MQKQNKNETARWSDYKFFAQNVNRMFKKYFNIAQNISEMDKTGIDILWKRFLYCFGRKEIK